MQTETEYRLRIDVFTPDTLPLRRMAEYLGEFARLLGEEPNVRFGGLRKGSAVLVAKVAIVAATKVRDRIRVAGDRDAPEPLRRLWRRLDGMMAADNATGALSEVGERGVVLRFPGRNRRNAEIGPVAQEGFLAGQLLRIGGQDQSAHATLQDGDQTYQVEMSRELARRLSQHLYGPHIRVSGRGRWRRTAEGVWELIEFKARDFTVLDAATVGSVIERLRALPADWREGDDPLGEWRRFREG